MKRWHATGPERSADFAAEEPRVYSEAQYHGLPLPLICRLTAEGALVPQRQRNRWPLQFLAWEIFRELQ